MSSGAARSRILAFALVTHVLMAAWLVVNGVAHTVVVVGKARAGTLSPGANAGSLVAVGVGLVVSGLWAFATCRTIWRARRENDARLGLPWSAVALVVLVLSAIGIAYGPGILRGSIAFAGIDAAALAFASVVDRGRRVK